MMHCCMLVSVIGFCVKKLHIASELIQGCLHILFVFSPTDDGDMSAFNNENVHRRDI